MDAFCRNCGQKLADGVRFCPNCGTKTTDYAQKESNSVNNNVNMNSSMNTNVNATPKPNENVYEPEQELLKCECHHANRLSNDIGKIIITNKKITWKKSVMDVLAFGAASLFSPKSSLTIGVDEIINIETKDFLINGGNMVLSLNNGKTEEFVFPSKKNRDNAVECIGNLIKRG